MVEIIQMDDATSESSSRLSGAYYHMLPEKCTSPKKLDHHGVKFHSPLTLKNKDDVTLVEDGMYWSNEVINNVDPGLDDDTIEAELRSLRSRKVKSLEEPTWEVIAYLMDSRSNASRLHSLTRDLLELI